MLRGKYQLRKKKIKLKSIKVLLFIKNYTKSWKFTGEESQMMNI
ncbi:hypothetical protein DFH84_000697 [Clostridium saccharobutylicum]|uniref:Uncharacterized protein n=1 Tax=Clostridium saccharobutylicum DSM 13864 TaxID=1345695 RepID=U5MYB1_CLOSA|nr:hypothetical protein [Clostridium saccharobutylicum]AGX44631.1 hypothetical protein CLSA_c36700 [Clostridium saccharobutylicum DSM 13864]NOV91595.1 hypothetical protein [Clostridium saccharobutylicum]NOW08808.1 hypothetical protein [Clostridium saccharobutylicum]NOW63804.1 hypothetical protein [Clostridium saccharobutylicum]NYC30603.1 hypothetical protein [Clostridium saccharobutylicum]